jgi:hypothetical protein
MEGRFMDNTHNTSEQRFPVEILTDRISLVGFIDNKFVIADRDRRILMLLSSAQLTSAAIFAELGLPRGRYWKHSDFLDAGEDLIDRCIALGQFDSARVGLEQLKSINRLDPEIVEALAKGER